MSPNTIDSASTAMASHEPLQSNAGNAIMHAQLSYDARKRSTGLAYVLWFFLGYLGVHRFYLGRVASGVAFLLLTLFCFFLTFATFGIGGIAFLLPFLWWVVDAFLIARIAEARNQALASELTA